MFLLHKLIRTWFKQVSDCLYTIQLFMDIVSDGTAKAVRKVYDAKFGSASTKSEAIVCSELAVLSEEDVQSDLQKCSFITLRVDVSNHKAVKPFPVLLHY